MTSTVDHPEPQRQGIWRAVVDDEIFPPGRQFRMNVTTGQPEVFEPADGIAKDGTPEAELPPDAADWLIHEAGNGSSNPGHRQEAVNDRVEQQVDLDTERPPTLADFVTQPQWVAWRNELRDGKLTKVPYVSAEQKAKSDAPSTWRPHDEAVLVRGAIDNGLGGGIGIMLGLCADRWIIGIDLDTCRDTTTGEIEPWAQAVIDRLMSYTELSPSETGAKIFLLINPEDAPELRRIMGTQHGRNWKRANGKEHPPAIELHISHRFFAVTWECLPDSSPELRTVPLSDLRWLIEQAGPAFAGKSQRAPGDMGAYGKSERASTTEDHGENHPDILIRLDATARSNQSVATALRNAATMHGGSRSEGAMGLGAVLKRAGWSFADMKAALLACPATRDWAEEQAAEGDRQFQRIWERADGGSTCEGDWGAQPSASAIPHPQTLADFLANAKPPAFLIEPLVQRGFLYTFTALTFHGKTTTLVYAALCVAAGMSFAGHHTEQGRVVYLAGENPDDTAQKFLAACDYWKLDPAALPITIVSGAFDLAGNIDELIRKIEAGGPVALIAVDTSAAYRYDADEDDNQGSKLWAQFLRRLTQLSNRPTVVIPTHPTKNAGRDALIPRGGGAFLNEVDGNLTLWADLEARTTELHWQGKLRGPSFSSITFDLRLHPHPTWRNRDGQPVETVVAVPAGILGTGERKPGKRPLERLKPMYIRWHEALVNALAITPTPGSTTKKAWFDECVRMSLTEAVEPSDSRQLRESKRRPFRDAVSKLVQAGWVGANGETIYNIDIRPKG
jgi:AAA domain